MYYLFQDEFIVDISKNFELRIANMEHVIKFDVYHSRLFLPAACFVAGDVDITNDNHKHGHKYNTRNAESNHSYNAPVIGEAEKIHRREMAQRWKEQDELERVQKAESYERRRRQMQIKDVLKIGDIKDLDDTMLDPVKQKEIFEDLMKHKKNIRSDTNHPGQMHQDRQKQYWQQLQQQEQQRQQQQWQQQQWERQQWEQQQQHQQFLQQKQWEQEKQQKHWQQPQPNHAYPATHFDHPTQMQQQPQQQQQWDQRLKRQQHWEHGQQHQNWQQQQHDKQPIGMENILRTGHDPHATPGPIVNQRIPEDSTGGFQLQKSHHIHDEVPGEPAESPQSKYNLSEGSMVEIGDPDAPRYGSIKWIGNFPGSNTKIAGVEMVNIIQPLL